MEFIINQMDRDPMRARIKNACRNEARANPKAMDANDFEVDRQGRVAVDPSQKLDPLGQCLARTLQKLNFGTNQGYTAGSGVVGLTLSYDSKDYLTRKAVVGQSMRSVVDQSKHAVEAAKYAPSYQEAIDAQLTITKVKCGRKERASFDNTMVYKFRFGLDGLVKNIDPRPTKADSEYTQCVVNSVASTKVPAPPAVLVNSYNGVVFAMDLKDGPQSLNSSGD